MVVPIYLFSKESIMKESKMSLHLRHAVNSIKEYKKSREPIPDEIFKILLNLEGNGEYIRRVIEDISDGSVYRAYQAYVTDCLVNSCMGYSQLPSSTNEKEDAKLQAWSVYQKIFHTLTVQAVVKKHGTFEMHGSVISKHGVSIPINGKMKLFKVSTSFGYHHLNPWIANYFYQLNCRLTQEIGDDLG
jgi:hypothetical protein